MKDFKGKVAVITGAGRGIGRGIALHCAREGMKIVLAGIRLDPLTRTAANLNAADSKAKKKRAPRERRPLLEVPAGVCPA